LKDRLGVRVKNIRLRTPLARTSTQNFYKAQFFSTEILNGF